MIFSKTRRGKPTARPLAAVTVVLATASAAAGQVGWWNRTWPYRRAVTVPPVKPTRLGGDEIAVLDMPTGGLSRPDGGDLRVTTTGRTEVPCRVLTAGPGDRVHLAFALRGAGTRYYVYFGHAKPPASTQKLDIRRGVLMETWDYPGGGIKTREQVEAIFRKAEKKPAGLVGRGFRNRVFLGHNPFGPQNRIATRFTAWLICPSTGSYQFACSSQDASFLLVDDRVIVDNGGHHLPQRDISKRGSTDLKKGLHKLTFYHVNTTRHPVAVAAWQAPSDKRVRPIPPEAFAPVVRAEPGAIEQYGKSIAVDFLPRYGGEVFLRDRYYQRWTFEMVASGRLGRDVDLRWDFGDGQTAASPKREHVYLVPGAYTVTLTVKTYRGELTRSNRIFVSRPWDQVATNRLDSVKQHARIVQEYEFSALDARANAEAILLLDRAKASDALRRAGAAFLERKEAPGALIELAVPLYVQDLPASERLATFRKAENMTSSPAVRATMAERAGRTALELGDPKAATEAFGRVVGRYGPATTVPAVRRAKIGFGDVWRARGDLAKATKAYRTAGFGAKVNVEKLAIIKGDYARHVEDYLRKGQFVDAAEFVERWEMDIPLDKLEGYWSLLVVRMAMAQRRYAAAVREAETLVKVNPASNYAAQLLMLAAKACGRLGKDAERRAALRQVVEKYPESPLAAEAAGLLGK